MVSKGDKDQRKAIRDELRRRERADAEVNIPLSKSELKQLFDWVNAKLEEAGCDDTLKHSISFLRQHDIAEDGVVAWLKEEGGYCDCEVIANVEDRWREILGGEI
ncbi:MAG TPA: DUF2695 domain-containing protein [Pyrinomonadaceae bacterium]|jgi:hypothetical protein